MGKDKFFKRFNELKNIMLECYDKIDLKKNEQLISASSIQSNVFDRYFNTVLKVKGPKGIFDGIVEAVNKNDKLTSTFISSFDFWIKNSYGSLKEETDKLFENKNLNEKEKLNVILDYMLKEPVSEDKEKLRDQFIKDRLTDFTCSYAKFNFTNMEAFIEGCNLDDKDYPDVSDFTNVFESPDKGLNHPFEKEINEMIESENKKENSDKDLIDSLNISNEILQDITDGSGLLSTMAEEQGKMAEKVFDQEYNKYKEENNVIFVEDAEPNNPEELVDYCKNNIIGEVKYSPKFKNVITKCVNFVIQKDYYNVNSMSSIFKDDADKLAKAIKEKDSYNIKRLSTRLNEKIQNVDGMIKELKSIDDQHMFNSNFASSREQYYPGKYRIDYEGATLMNHVIGIAKVCKNHNIKPEELLNNPTEVVKSVYKNAMTNPNSPYNNFIHKDKKDVFAKINNMVKNDEDLFDAKDDESIIDNDFIQLSPILSVNNPENRFETFHKITSDIRTTMQLKHINDELLFDGFKSKEVFLDAFPKIAMMGNDFNPYLHFNYPGLCDIDTKDYRKPYDLQDYMKNMSLKDILDKFTDTYKKLEEHEQDKYYNNFVSAMDNLEKEVSKSFIAKGMDKDVATQMISFAKAKELTPMQTNTSNAIINFYNSNGTEKEIKNNKINVLADLDKKYNSHNLLAQIFFPKLRAQNSLIKKMKADLVANGNTKEEIENAIKAINKPEKQKVNEPNQEKEVTKENQIEDNVKQEYIDPRGYTIFNIDDKMADLDDKLAEYCKTGKKEIKKELLGLGVTNDELEYLKYQVENSTESSYFYSKSIISRIESDFIEKDRANDKHTINDIGFNKPNFDPSIDYEERDNDIEQNLHIDYIQDADVNVKFDDTNSHRQNSKPSTDIMKKETGRMLIAGGILKSIEPDTNVLQIYNGLSRRQQNECKRAYNKERGIEKEAIIKPPKKTNIEKEDRRTVDEKAADYLKELYKADEERKEQYTDSIKTKANRNASLAKLYKEDNPNITTDELLIRGKLAADEINSTMEVNELKELVDRRFELFTIGKENTNGSESELINDVLKQGSNVKDIEDLIKEAKDDLARLEISDEVFEESNPVNKESLEKEDNEIVKEEVIEKENIN